MVELSLFAINNSCKMVRIYFPSTQILSVFKEITCNQDLKNFPCVKNFEEKISKTKKPGLKITLKAVTEISTFFYENQNSFLSFLKELTSDTMQFGVINRVTLDEFVTKVSAILYDDSRIIINNKTIQKWVQNKAEKDVYLNVNVPEYIEDYFSEALDCLAYGMHRSSIIFGTFALEGALRYKYAKIVDEKKAYSHSVKFSSLIDWGIKNNLIDEDDFNKTNINFIRNFRNQLAHANLKNIDAKKGISRKYAQQMSKIIIFLIEMFINNIFY